MCFVTVRAAKMLFYSKIWQIWSEDIASNKKKSESILRKYDLKFVAKSISLVELIYTENSALYLAIFLFFQIISWSIAGLFFIFPLKCY